MLKKYGLISGTPLRRATWTGDCCFGRWLLHKAGAWEVSAS
jgi:hypothetical protein